MQTRTPMIDEYCRRRLSGWTLYSSGLEPYFRARIRRYGEAGLRSRLGI